MKIAVVGNYTFEQLDYCVSSIWGQKSSKFEVIFSCCDSKYMLAYLIQRVQTRQENDAIISVNYNRNYGESFAEQLDYALKLTGQDKMLLLFNGAALYDVYSIQRCVDADFTKTCCVMQTVLYDGADNYISETPSSKIMIYGWSKKHTRILQACVINGYNWQNHLVKCNLQKLICLKHKSWVRHRIDVIRQPIVKAYIADCIKKVSSEPGADVKIDWFPVQAVYKYCSDNNIKINILDKECRSVVYEPAFWEYTEGKEFVFNRPSVYSAEISCVNIVAESGIILKDNLALCDEFAYDKEIRNQPIFEALIERNGDSVGLMYQEMPEKQNKVINLLGWAPYNYYHFVLETMAKLTYLNDTDVYDDYTLLIDATVKRYQQFLDFIELLRKGRKIVYVEKGYAVFANSAVNVSPVSWMCTRLLDRKLWLERDSLIVTSSIDNIRKAVKVHIKEMGNRKIFISRKSTLNSRIQNEEQIQKIFLDAGFEVVQTENMTLFEQIECFSTAKCVVGATGAALTNIIYCNPGTVIGCIKVRDARFFKYSTIAHYLKLRSLYAECKVIEYHKESSANICSMDVEYCKRYVAKLLGMIQDEGRIKGE